MCLPFMDHGLVRRRGLQHSMKLWSCHTGPPKTEFIVKSSNKMWSTVKGNGNPLQHSSLENPISSMKRQKDMTPEDEHSGSESI